MANDVSTNAGAESKPGDPVSRLVSCFEAGSEIAAFADLLFRGADPAALDDFDDETLQQLTQQAYAFHQQRKQSQSRRFPSSSRFRCDKIPGLAAAR